MLNEDCGTFRQAEAKAAKVCNEHRIDALRRACHAKIQGVQKANTVQLQSLKVHP